MFNENETMYPKTNTENKAVFVAKVFLKYSVILIKNVPNYQ